MLTTTFSAWFSLFFYYVACIPFGCLLMFTINIWWRDLPTMIPCKADEAVMTDHFDQVQLPCAQKREDRFNFPGHTVNSHRLPRVETCCFNPGLFKLNPFRVGSKESVIPFSLHRLDV